VTNEQLLVTPCDVLVPAASNARSPKRTPLPFSAVPPEAANGPTTPKPTPSWPNSIHVFVIPDILCNAGGVIVSYFEWVQDLQSFF